ncbi:MAG TPA: MFS transporter, partial [Micromonosporaceae bacterium]|nr:MFS transporter [Micromonosporaceae bacterium]
SGAGMLGAGVAAVGFGWSVTLPAYSTLIARMVSGEAQSRAFTARYALFNVGMGIGAAIGALLMPHGLAGALALLWWLASATCVASIAIVWLARARDHAVSAAAPGDGDEPVPGGYRRVFADRPLRRVLVAALLFAAAGYGVYGAGLPVLAIESGAPQAMGAVNVANCLTVAAGLPLALAATKRFGPVQLLALTALLWSAGWAICAVQAETSALPGTAVLVAAAVLMGLGEITLAGALPALVNALAPDELRGRYNAVLTLATTAGLWAGPMLTAGAAALGAVPALFCVSIVLLAAAPAVVGRSSIRGLAEVPA